jgi:soluble lytic murein transglycosylase-like protein
MLRLFALAVLLFGGLTYMGLKRISTGGRFNDDFDHLFLASANAVGVPPELLKAIAMTESGTRFEYSDIVEPKGGTVGIMHIKLSTARDYEPSMTAQDLLNPENEIRVAAKFVADLWAQFDGDMTKVAWGYNAGASRVHDNIMPITTREYIERFGRNLNRVLGA